MAAEVRAIEADIPMGMTQVEDGDHKVLFIRDKNGLRAFQADCPHAGAPLADGKICGHTLYCPWHKAAFDVGDGALIEPPALEALQQYPIRTEGEKVVATLEAMAQARPSARADKRTFVIVGTGAAAVAAVTTLRHEGFGGKIVMIGREAVAPYDRTMLSKAFLAGEMTSADLTLDDDFAETHQVDIIHGTVTRIEPAKRTVTLDGARTIEGDALLVATGSAAVRPALAGDDLEGIFTLRSLDDAIALTKAADAGKTVAIIGGGFVGLEAAASLAKRGLAVTLISPEPLPLAARFGDDVARAVKVHHEGTGIQFRQGKVARFEGERAIAAVRLEGGDTIPADLVLVGAGAKPETSMIDAPKRDDGGIEVDATLQLAPNVWLAGDIAAFPEAHSGTIARIEHWRLAEQHGRHAAFGMMGKAAPFEATPYFWTNQGDLKLAYAGYAPRWDKIDVRGSIEKGDFIAYYILDGKPLAACAMGQNEQMIAFIHLLTEQRLPQTANPAAEDLAKVA